MGENGEHVGFVLPCLIIASNSRTANMKVITQIYLNCRPELRDEWLTGMEPEDQNEAQVRTYLAFHYLVAKRLKAQEQALRHLLKFCWYPRYI